MKRKRTGEYESDNPYIMLRIKNDLSYLEVSNRIGCVIGSWQSWEMGRSLPGITYLEALCDLSGLSYDEFVKAAIAFKERKDIENGLTK